MHVCICQWRVTNCSIDTKGRNFITQAGPVHIYIYIYTTLCWGETFVTEIEWSSTSVETKSSRHFRRRSQTPSRLRACQGNLFDPDVYFPVLALMGFTKEPSEAWPYERPGDRAQEVWGFRSIAIHVVKARTTCQSLLTKDFMYVKWTILIWD